MFAHLAVAAVVVSSSLQPLPSAPSVMAALGDSISAGFNACGWYVPCTSRSWAAGDDREVNSHSVRLGMREGNLNFAVPGATSADLGGQVRQAVDAGAGYVTVLIGAQDACVSSERKMTPVAVYRDRVARALWALKGGAPGVRVFVASIPDVRRLWQAGKDNVIARTFWAVGRICQAMLAEPTSTARADVERRARVRARVVAYNEVLADLCARFGPNCRFDGGAVFAYPYSLKHISKWDFFHPNAVGQKALAEVTYKKGFDWLNGIGEA
ncbi:MAG: SGNH/GDSL hydrolase family protein [Thermoactinospora sp.]|nr:SGNH/GDSL hydrolase family protein [Thermoactinospora sp.]